MPLSCATPLTITPAIMHNQEYATEYLAHVSLIRELLEQSSLTPNPALLASSGNRLLQSLSGLLTHSSNFPLTREPILIWNLARVIRLCDRADAVYHQTRYFRALRRHLHQYALLAPMPVSKEEVASFMHPKLVTYLTGFQPYFSKGGLIPHLTRKGMFWKSQPTAISNAMLQFKLCTVGDASAELDKLDKVECGCVPPLPQVHNYNTTTGMHVCLGRGCSLKHDQSWIKQDAATSKAASAAVPPSWVGATVSGLTQRFEQL